MAAIDWDALARIIDVFSREEYTPILHQFYPWMVDCMDARDLEPTTILDLGGGTGLLTQKLIEWYPDAAITLVDGNASMLARARERVEGRELVTLVNATIEDALEEQADASIEMMVFCRSWYCLRDPEKTAARAVEVLAPKGLIFLFDFTRALAVESLEEFYRELEPVRWPDYRALVVDFAEGVANGSYRLYSEEEITSLWHAAGADRVAYQSHEPDFPNFRMCLAKA